MGLFSHTWIGCFLAFLPGPPRLKFYNAQFQLFPVDKTNKYCPEVQAGRDVGFYLFSRKFPEEPLKLKIGDDAPLTFSDLDLRLPTVIYFPPFFDGIDSRNVREVKEAYLQKGGYNFVVVGSERLNAGPWYPWQSGLALKNLHLVGLSIGAHAAGVAGRYLKSGRPPRITGLDPASFLFMGKHRDSLLDQSDADFVDVIHTDRVFGMFYPIGDADFFVNADVYPQPGCRAKNLTRARGLLFTVFCSHLRSNELYARSVTKPTIFPGSKCPPRKEFSCLSNSIQFMGIATSPTAKGIYYVRTR